jgi:Uma2 family endonuclease
VTALSHATASSPRPLAAYAATFTSDEFFAMIDAGIFVDRPVFLWEGRIFERMAKGFEHATTAMLIQEALSRRVPPGWSPWVENPLQVAPDYAPLPDKMIVRGTSRDYHKARRHPGPADVGLLIEIAVTSLAQDLQEGAELWARAGIPHNWVVDVVGRRIIEHSGPQLDAGRGRYTEINRYVRGESVPLVFDGVEVARIPIEELVFCD